MLPSFLFLTGVPASVRAREIDYPGLFFLPGVPASVRAQEIGNPGLSSWGNVAIVSEVFNVGFPAPVHFR